MDPLLNEMKRLSQTISSSLTNSQEAQRILLSYFKEIQGSGNTNQSIKCCSPNGLLIWQLLVEGMDVYLDDFTVIPEERPSTYALIAQQSCRLASMHYDKDLGSDRLKSVC